MLTQEQIDYFHTNGYLIMRGLIKGKELEMLQKAADKVQAEGVAREGIEHRYYKNKDGSETYWRSEKIWNRDDIFKAATVNQELLENIGQCIGHSFYPWNDSLVVKLAHSGAPVKWHQDPPYFEKHRELSFPIPNFTTDIYLDHSGPENGGVWAIHGKHLVGHVDFSKVTEEELFSKCGAVPLEMEAGDVLFHCLSTPHGSSFNHSAVQRRIFYVHYLNEEVYQDAYAKQSWADQLPGWSGKRHESIENMLKKRTELGLQEADLTSHLKLTKNGFEFHGNPITPHKYWGNAHSKFTEQEIAELKVIHTIK